MVFFRCLVLSLPFPCSGLPALGSHKGGGGKHDRILVYCAQRLNAGPARFFFVSPNSPTSLLLSVGRHWALPAYILDASLNSIVCRYWSICNPVSCQWVVRNSSIPAVHSSRINRYGCFLRSNIAHPQAMSTRTGQEIILAIISIAGGIAMACKTMAEISKKVQPHAPHFLFEQIVFLSFV